MQMTLEAPLKQPPAGSDSAAEGQSDRSRAISFSSHLANVLYGSAADPTRERFEVEAVERYRQTMAHATSRQIFQCGPFIDAALIPRLSGRNRLAVAKMIETRAPAAIENMPNLRKDREHMRKSAELEQILSPNSLAQMIAALAADLEARGVR